MAMNAAIDHQAYRTGFQSVFLAPAERRTASICFILSDGFDALSLSSAIAPMRAANETAAFELFTWHFRPRKPGRSGPVTAGWSR